MENDSKTKKKQESTNVSSAITISSSESLPVATTQPSSASVSVDKEKVNETVYQKSRWLEIQEIILEFRSQLAQILLHVCSFFVRICKILQILSEMFITTYKMLCFAYNYPNASRHATWITYRALMISYKLRLWSLSGLCNRVNNKVEKKLDDKKDDGKQNVNEKSDANNKEKPVLP